MKSDRELVRVDTPKQHMQWFREFCQYEMLTGGPDPHMKAVVKMCEGLSIREKLWRAALYVGVYNVPSAEAIWRHLLVGEINEAWLKEHWQGIRIRRERRTANTPIKLCKYLAGYQQTLNALPVIQRETQFENLWSFVMNLPRVGRYAATKLIEIWARLGITKVQHVDIRAKDGWSPRAALKLFFPNQITDVHSNDKVSIEMAERLAKMVHERIGIRFSVFELEVMLCEYKASYSTHRQYPGRSLDSELKYENAVKSYWNFGGTEHMKTRRLISPKWALGELNGWDGVRDELGLVLSSYGYTWSDSVYDFKKTTDFANPVRKGI